MNQLEPNRAACLQACITEQPGCDFWSYDPGTEECLGFGEITGLDANADSFISGDRLCKLRKNLQVTN